MQPIQRKEFFDSYRGSFGTLLKPLVLQQPQVDGIEQLLSFLENDPKITDLRHAAYMLATTRHETGNEWHPIKEYGLGKGFKYGVPDSVTGQTYFGRGYVQITWKANYKAMEEALGLSLLHHPDLALDPATAYQIMSYGMRTGAFTGVGLNRFIHGDVCDYVGARKIINGTDRSELVAGYATKIEAALRAGVSNG